MQTSVKRESFLDRYWFGLKSWQRIIIGLIAGIIVGLALGEKVHASQGVDQILAPDGDLALEGVGEQALVLGEVALDEARAKQDVTDPEERLVLRKQDLHPLFIRGSVDATNLLHRPGRYDRLPRPIEGGRQLGLLDAQPVRVRRDHPDARLLEGD